MHWRMAGGMAMAALFTVTFATGASADDIRLSKSRVGHMDDVVFAWFDGGGAGLGRSITIGPQSVGIPGSQTANSYRHGGASQGSQAATAPGSKKKDKHKNNPLPSPGSQPVVPADGPVFPVDPGVGLGGPPDFVPGLVDPPTDLAVGPAADPLATPEPASLVLLGSGLAAAGFFGARRKRNANA